MSPMRKSESITPTRQVRARVGSASSCPVTASRPVPQVPNQSRPNLQVRSRMRSLIKRKCPDRTLVSRNSLPGREYGRTHSNC
jgi:hypothetical protein